MALPRGSSFKTRRTPGHNILVGAVTGATVGIIYGVATAKTDSFFSYSASEGATAHGLVASVGGAAIGAITTLFNKKSKFYIIDGDALKWKEFKETITGIEQ